MHLTNCLSIAIFTYIQCAIAEIYKKCTPLFSNNPISQAPEVIMCVIMYASVESPQINWLSVQEPREESLRCIWWYSLPCAPVNSNKLVIWVSKFVQCTWIRSWQQSSNIFTIILISYESYDINHLFLDLFSMLIQEKWMSTHGSCSCVQCTHVHKFSIWTHNYKFDLSTGTLQKDVCNYWSSGITK